MATYTDSVAVAAAYAVRPNHHEDKHAEDPRLWVGRFKPEKPYILGDPETEDVVTWDQLRKTLDLTEAERDKLIASIEWRQDGDWTQVEKDKWPDPEIYTDSYRLGNNQEFLQMVRSRGYDSIGLRGTFTAGDMLEDFPDLPLGSYRDDDFSVMEWKPLQPEVVVEIANLSVNKDLAAKLKTVRERAASLGEVLEESVRIGDLNTEDIEGKYGEDILKEIRPIRFLEPKDIACLRDREGKLLNVSFEGANAKSKALVEKYSKADIRDEVIIMDGTTLCDGYHRAVAAMKTGRCIRAIDLSDEPPKSNTVLVVVHPDQDISSMRDRERVEKSTARTARKLLKWMDTHPHVPVSVLLSPTPGAYAPETQRLLTQIRERAVTEMAGEHPAVAAKALRTAHPKESLVLAGFYRERCVKDVWRYLGHATISKDLTMSDPQNRYRC